jgi:hypothetical protein
MKSFILLLLFTTVAWSDDRHKFIAGFDPAIDIIADNYEAGAYLIYDCQERHWTCVTEPFYQICQEERSRDVAAEGVYHSCAPIGALPTKKSCFQRQLFMLSQNHGQRFCVRDEWKTKAVKY